MEEIKMGTFEIFKGSDEHFYFRLKAPNGEIIAQSQGYASKQGAEKGISSVQEYAAAASVVTL